MSSGRESTHCTMAAAILFTFSLCLLFCEVLSKPVAHDSKLMQSSHNLGDTQFVENIERDTKKVPSPGVNSARDNKLVQSLDSVLNAASSLTDSLRSVRRVKRQVIVGNGCAKGWIWYINQCIPLKKYEQIMQEEEMEK